MSRNAYPRTTPSSPWIRPSASIRRTPDRSRKTSTSRRAARSVAPGRLGWMRENGTLMSSPFARTVGPDPSREGRRAAPSGASRMKIGRNLACEAEFANNSNLAPNEEGSGTAETPAPMDLVKSIRSDSKPRGYRLERR